MRSPTPPIGAVALLEIPLNNPDAPADLSLPVPHPSARRGWDAWSPLLQALDRALSSGRGGLRDPWLEFDQPFQGPPGLFLRLMNYQTDTVQALQSLRNALVPQEPNAHGTLASRPWPTTLPGDDVEISHLGLFPDRPAHREGRWRLNLTGAGQTAWLRGRHPALEAPELNHLLACDDLSWSATFDWGNDGLSHLGFELFPAGRLQQGSAWPDPAVDRLIAQVRPWLPSEALERSLERQVHWQHHHQPSHRIGFSHFKLMPTATSPNDWMLKLYLLSHATG